MTPRRASSARVACRVHLSVPLAGRILRELKDKSASRKRAGFVVAAGAPVREGTALFDADGAEVGVVTSGGFSPCLKKGIGMCYVPPGLNKAGTELSAQARRGWHTPLASV